MAAVFEYRLKNDSSSDNESEDSDKECLNWKRSSNNVEITEKTSVVLTEADPSEMQTTGSSKRKRNTIWCEVLEDQMMSETLNHCGIKNKPKGYGSRGEESYDYTLGKKDYKEKNSENEEMLDKSLRSSSKFHKRFKYENFVELDTDSVAAAKKIIKVLAEQKGYLIYRIVKYIGIEKSMQLLKMTEDIEENGGLMIQNQRRRRTPGGVYLHLLRSDKSIEKEVINKIFEGELNSFEKKKKFDEFRKTKNKRKKKSKQLNKLSAKPSENEMEVEEENGKETSECTNAVVNGNALDLEEGEVE